MEVFYYTVFGFLGVVVAVLELNKNNKDRINTSQPFNSFKNNYLVVYSLMMAGDWLQGPYVYYLYMTYGYSKGEIGQLFIAGFGSSMLFGTVVGSLADKQGRKRACVTYCITYILSCITKHSPQYKVLMLGRVLGGIATSLLFSAFESWLVAEHNKRNFDQQWLSLTFSKAIFLPNIFFLSLSLYIYIHTFSFSFSLSKSNIIIMAINGVSPTGGLIVSFGEMLIDFVPTVSGVSLADAPGFLKAPGGAPANVAIAVSRLGGKAAFVGKLGDDEFGLMLARILEQNGVSADGVTFDKGARTALAFVTLRADGEREFMFYRNPSADMLLTPDELNVELIRSARVFHYGSISLIVEPCRSSHLKAMEVAKEAGALLSYDPNLRLPLWPSAEEAREKILSIWDKADVIKVSDNELEFLTGKEVSDEAAMSLWHPNLKLLLVTLGEKGCSYYTKNFHGSIPGFHVQTVDTTGAGDSFIGALLCKMVEDQSIITDEAKLKEVLKFACACGAITTTKKGAIPALPTESEALTVLNAA